jgi:hypothetical protein
VGACTAIPSEPPNEEGGDGAQTKNVTKPLPEVEPKPEPATDGACKNPKPVLANGRDTGYVECGDGALNRATALVCANPVNAPACQGNEKQRSCDSDADCTDKPHGFCMGGTGQIGTYCSCIYPCHDDSECGEGQACMCPDAVSGGPPAATCSPAACKQDSDCPSGECGATFHFNGCYEQTSLQCRDAGDACRGDSECGDNGSCAALDRGEGIASVSFECAQMSCVIGRPLTVDAGTRVADLSSGRWGDAQLESLEPSPGRANYWLAVARMEHASVASFARFVQELMGFGAPPDLLSDALVAAADEVRHAEQTFAIASAYAGEPVAPGALRVADLAPTTDLEVFVTRLIVEGCVGETVGVAEALALLDGELDPALQPIVEGIAADEARHSALAWRTLRWVATRVRAEVVERAFERAVAAVACVDAEPVDPAHGRLGTARKREVRVRALARVVEPCRAELRRAAA